MAARKDNKGRQLRKGEFQRKSDGKYVYGYTDPNGVRRYIYSKDLKTLRDREDRLVRDQLDGLDVYVAGSADLNFLFDRYMSTKSELRETTYVNYVYMYDHFVRDGFGKKKIREVKYSDVLQFYHDLLNKGGQRYYGYNIYTATTAVLENGAETIPEGFTKIVSKEDNKVSTNTIFTKDNVSGKARYVLVEVTSCNQYSESAKYVVASIYELKVHGA